MEDLQRFLGKETDSKPERKWSFLWYRFESCLPGEKKIHRNEFSWNFLLYLDRRKTGKTKLKIHTANLF